VLHDEQAFVGKFINYMLERNIKIEADLVDQLFNSSEKRLARALLILARYGKAGEPETMVAKISQETLAELVGTTRSRVNFFMNKFRKLGFVNYNVGGMQVHRSLLNVVLHDSWALSLGSNKLALSALPWKLRALEKGQDGAKYEQAFAHLHWVGLSAGASDSYC
jgi:CRP/FNR family cyclic AMP-dependent transcriptional regulator